MLAKGTLYMLLSQALLILSGYLVNVALGQVLGPEEFGRFATMASLTVLLEMVFLLGIPRALSKHVAETGGGSRAALRWFGGLQLLCGGILFLALVALARPLATLLRDPLLGKYIRIVAWAVPAIAVFQFYTKLLNGLVAYPQQAIALGVLSILRLVLTFGLVVALGAGTAGALWALVFAVTVASLVAAILYRTERRISVIDWAGNPLLIFAAQFAVLMGAWTFLDTADQLFVKALTGAGPQAGYYAAAALFGKIPRFVAFALSAAIFPLVAQSVAAQNQRRVVQDLRQAIRGLLILAAPLLALALTVGRPLLTTFLGAAYSPAGNVLWVLVLASTLIGLAYLLCTAITAAGGILFAVGVSLLMVTVNSLLWLVLIPRIGIVGAALAMTLTALLSFVALLRYVTREFGPILVARTWLRVGLASAVIGAMAYPIENVSGWGVSMLGASLLLVYLGILVLLGELGTADVRVLLSTLPAVRLRQPQG